VTSAIRLYLDEDVRPLLAAVLCERGYDAVSAVELGRIALSDADHFEFAASEGRMLLTFNIRDYVPLAAAAIRVKHDFAGLLVSDQIPCRELLRRVLRRLGSRQSLDVANTIIWLSDYR